MEKFKFDNIYDPLTTKETPEEKKRRVQKTLNKAEKIMHETMALEKGKEICEENESHLFKPEERLYYKVIKKDHEYLFVELYEYYVCVRCGVAFYKLYVNKEIEKTGLLKRTKEQLEKENIFDIYERGEVYI